MSPLRLPTGRQSRADKRYSQIMEDRPYPGLVFRTASRNHAVNIGSTRSTKFCVVNTQDGLAEMIQAITSHQGTTLYVAVEASLLTLHAHPQPGCSYIIDLQSLGASAFEPREAAEEAAAETEPEHTERPVAHLPSLQAILEGSSIPKVLFDCHQAWAFLAGRFGVMMGRVEDIQCLELEGCLPRQEGTIKAERGLRSCLE